MRTRNRNGAVSAAVLLVLAFASRPMHAQILYGSLMGNVNDTSSAAVPAASLGEGSGGCPAGIRPLLAEIKIGRRFLRSSLHAL